MPLHRMKAAWFTLLASVSIGQAADFRVLIGHGGPIMDATISADGQRALTASFDNSVGFWTLENEKVRWLEGHEAAVKTAIFLDDTRAASGGDDFAIKIWDLTTGTHKKLDGHKGQIAELAVSPNGSVLASASWDGSVGLWNINDGTGTMLIGHQAMVNDVAFSEDGTRLYSASADGTLRVWDVLEKSEKRQLVNHGFGINKLLLGPGWIAYGAVDGGTRIIDPETGNEIADLTLDRRPILAMAAAPDGSEIAVSDGQGFVMTVATDGWFISGDYKAAAKGPVWALAYTADSQSLIAGGIDDAAYIWPAHNDLDAPIMSTDQRGFLRDPEAMSNGERQFQRKCSVCHSLTEEGIRRAGPTLSGLMGRPAGSVSGYAYSDTVATLGLEWTEETIDQLFDLGPDHFIPGSKMPMQRIVKPEDRQDLIQFLKDNT